MAEEYEDKQWARKYLLDPLTAPEPNQETGPGSSHVQCMQRSFSLNSPRRTPKPITASARNISPQHSVRSLPSTPNRFSLPATNPFSSEYRGPVAGSPEPPEESNRGGNPFLHRSPSLNSQRNPFGPPGSRIHGARTHHRNSFQTESIPEDASNPSQAQLSPSPNMAPLSKRSSMASNNPFRSGPHSNPSTPSAASASSKNPFFTEEEINAAASGSQGGVRRSSSLRERHPGDLSHRPLDMIRREARAADRAPHRPPRASRRQPAFIDTIDSLDTTGVNGAPFHHSGPYDAALAGLNTNKLYSPLEAVRDSNMAALRATPREYINDSLTKHVPLQGIATVPPGERDMAGRVMRYEEGADLMREPDAGGGPYKRWQGIDYHPDDLKGKGEAYVLERDLKAQKARMKASGAEGGDVELQPTHGPGHRYRRVDGGQHRDADKGKMSAGRPRSASAAPPTSPTSPGMGPSGSGSSGSPRNAAAATGADPGSNGETGVGVRRSNTTGKKISEGLKRRFGSLRRKVET